MQLKSSIIIGIVRILIIFVLIWKCYKSNKPDVYNNFGMILCLYIELFIIIIVIITRNLRQGMLEGI